MNMKICGRIAEYAKNYAEHFLGAEVRPVNYMDDGSAEVIVEGCAKTQFTQIYHVILGMCLMYAEEHHINTMKYWHKQPCIVTREKGSFTFFHIFTEETNRLGKSMGMKED